MAETSPKTDNTPIEENPAPGAPAVSEAPKADTTGVSFTSDTPSDMPADAGMEAEAQFDPNVYVPEYLTMTAAPHVHTEDTTRSVMVDVCIALLPALIWGIYIFGLRALTITLVSIAAAVLSEFLFQKLLKRPVTVLDFSAVVTGLLLALNLPVTVPLWMPAIGAVFAIVVVKQLFGGLGKNFVNPALAARVFLFAWPSHMNTFITPDSGRALSAAAIALPAEQVDAVASATSLATLKTGAIPTGSTLFNAVIGYEGGCIGEVSALLLIAGFIYLLYRKIVTWHIPVAYIGTVLIVTFVFSKSSLPFDFALWEIFSGGLFLGAIFMATDYATSPLTGMGRLIYGIGCGLVTVFIRYFGGYPEGVSFAILIMNLLVWYIDRYTKPVRFGGVKVAGANQRKKG